MGMARFGGFLFPALGLGADGSERTAFHRPRDAARLGRRRRARPRVGSLAAAASSRGPATPIVCDIEQSGVRALVRPPERQEFHAASAHGLSKAGERPRRVLEAELVHVVGRRAAPRVFLRIVNLHTNVTL